MAVWSMLWDNGQLSNNTHDMRFVHMIKKQPTHGTMKITHTACVVVRNQTKRT